MIQHIDDHIPPFDDAANEREWLAQERAMRRERLQLDPAGDDARSRRYRLLARALREPLPEALPADFAQRLAARVAAIPARRAAPGRSFESTLMLALATVLAVAAGAVVAIYGGAWLPSFLTLLPTPHAPATRWLLALAGCLGASWLLGQWQRHAQGKTD
jgi:anti-sigma factor RsiW